MVAGHDLGDLWERQYRPKKGPPGLAPADLFAQTAAQLFRMFFAFAPARGAAAPPESDAVALAAAVNRRRAEKGLPPTIPPYLLRGVPRAR